MLVAMKKVRIIGPKSSMKKTIAILHRLSILHVVEKDIPDIENGSPLVTAEEISATLVKARAVASQLKIPLEGKRSKVALASIHKDVERLAAGVEEQTATLTRLELEIEKRNAYDFETKLLKALGLTRKMVTGYQSLVACIGTIKQSAAFEAALRVKTKRYMMAKGTMAKKEYIALFVDKRLDAEVQRTLQEHDFSSLSLGSLDAGIRPLSKLRTAKTQAQKELVALRKKCIPALSHYIQILEEALEKAEAPLQWKETEAAFLVYGYIPKKKYGKTVDVLNRGLDSRIYIEEEEIAASDKVPIELENPRGVSSFRFFLDLYTLPNYKELDPSWFLAISFPLLFGFMLGDYGYGLATLGIFWFLKKILPQFKDFFNILMYASLGTVFFGLLFGEFFGAEFYHPLINRNPAHSLTPLMVAAVVAGIIHVNAGLAVGFMNEYRSHGFKTAFLEKSGWVFLQIAAGLLAVSYAGIVALPVWVGYLVLVGAFVLLYLGEGVRGLIEIPSIFGNILSYMRLMAIGLSSVGLALVVNRLAGDFFDAGGMSILWGVILLVGGHMINIGIGCLGSFLHSLRLHYVELFSKFYKGGGIKFKPFGVRE